MTREKNICFLEGNRVVVKEGTSYLRNFTGTVLYSMTDYAWVEFDKRLPEVCRNHWFPLDCPQGRWAKIHKTMLRHLTTEKGTKLRGTSGHKESNIEVKLSCGHRIKHDGSMAEYGSVKCPICGDKGLVDRTYEVAGE